MTPPRTPPTTAGPPACACQPQPCRRTRARPRGAPSVRPTCSTLRIVRNPYRSPAKAALVRDWCSAALASWAVPHETHLVDTSHGQTHVVSAGTATGARPRDGICLYLPGTNFTAATSTVALSELASRCVVYAADLPGQPGLSAATRPDPELSGYATWLTDLVAWVKGRHPGRRIVLAGHSRGAAVALSANPDAVDGLALLSPAGLTRVRPSIEMLRATLPWLLRRDPAGATRLLTYMSGPGHVPTNELVEWMALLARTCRTTGAPGPLPKDRLTSWRGRDVRVAVGQDDVFFPVTELREACRTTLGHDLQVVPGAGHLLVDEEPVLVADLVTSLL
jgi:pimeloyl-ACP methyl ester carboxylesterase